MSLWLLMLITLPAGAMSAALATATFYYFNDFRRVMPTHYQVLAFLTWFISAPALSVFWVVYLMLAPVRVIEARAERLRELRERQAHRAVHAPDPQLLFAEPAPKAETAISQTPTYSPVIKPSAVGGGRWKRQRHL